MEAFVARQPIFDRQQNVYAYELLYRFGLKNIYDSQDGDRATSEVIANSFLLIGIETVTGGKKAFINFTDNLLRNEVATYLPKELVAVEILETVEPDEDILAACRKLKDLGYILVLDDFIFKTRFEHFLDLADIVKIDFLNTKPDQRTELVKRLSSRNVRLLAEKVETREEFQQALKMGFSYFQGYFFSRPVILSRRDVPAYKLNYLQILQEASRPDFDFNRLDGIVKRDVSLSYKLLKYINSAAFGFRTRITSIKHALVMLGIIEIKKWVSLIALRGIAEDKPNEIVTSSIIRARFGELLAPWIGMGENSSDLFIMGIFSMIDALICRPMAECLGELPISDEIKYALTGRECRYRDVLKLIMAYEKADWEEFSRYAAAFKLDEAKVPELYLRSINWANQLFHS